MNVATPEDGLHLVEVDALRSGEDSMDEPFFCRQHKRLRNMAGIDADRSRLGDRTLRPPVGNQLVVDVVLLERIGQRARCGVSAHGDALVDPLVLAGWMDASLPG